MDQWFSLQAVAHKGECKGGDIGNIRLKARYTVREIIEHCNQNKKNVTHLLRQVLFPGRK